MNSRPKPTNKRNLLIVDQRQFGSHLGTYHFSIYLNQKYNITVICWDYLLTKQDTNNFNVVYVSRSGNLIRRNIRFIYSVLNWLKINECDICFIKYFRGCSILKIFHPRLTYVFDIRTGAVNNNALFRFMYNAFMLFESLFFKNITIISESLSRKLKLSKKASILPLGSESISANPKTFDTLDLIYVGTLSGRDIEKSLLGFAKFYNHHKNIIPMSYTIIGDGANNEVQILNRIVAKHALTQVVSIAGRIPFTQLEPYFKIHNVGVSFVPLTDYFDAQPVTKTFDYLLSGMPVIATATSENKLVINESNGVLIKDTADDFYQGIESILNNKNNYDSQQIINNSKKYSWKQIVDDFGNYLEKISS